MVGRLRNNNVFPELIKVHLEHENGQAIRNIVDEALAGRGLDGISFGRLLNVAVDAELGGLIEPDLVDKILRVMKEARIEHTTAVKNILLKRRRYSLESALDFYQEMLADSVCRPDAYTYTTFAGICSLHGDPKTAMQLLTKAKEVGISLGPTFYDHLLTCFGRANDLQGAKKALSLAEESGNTSLWLRNTYIGNCAKVGDAEEAQRTFDALPKPDIISYNSLMATYSKTEPRRTLKIFHDLVSEDPKSNHYIEADDCTYITALNACRNAHLQEEGEAIIKVFKDSDLKSSLTSSRLAAVYEAWLDIQNVTNNFPKAALISKEMKQLGIFRDRTVEACYYTKNKQFKFKGGESMCQQSTREITEELWHRVRAETDYRPDVLALPVTFRELHNGQESQQACLCFHAEKIALASMVSLNEGYPPIHVNVNMCEDCVEYFKNAAIFLEEDLKVFDLSKLHHFSCMGGG